MASVVWQVAGSVIYTVAAAIIGVILLRYPDSRKILKRYAKFLRPPRDGR